MSYPFQPNVTLSLRRRKEVEACLGRGRSSLYSDIKAGLFVKPVSIGARAVGWPSNEVDTIIAARIAGKSDEEIRALVLKLEAARKAAE